MKPNEQQQKLAGLLLAELLSEINVEEAAGQLDEIIFEFASYTGEQHYGEWFTNRIWLLEEIRNIFLFISGGKMQRALIFKSPEIEAVLKEV